MRARWVAVGLALVSCRAPEPPRAAPPRGVDTALPDVRASLARLPPDVGRVHPTDHEAAASPLGAVISGSAAEPPSTPSTAAASPLTPLPPAPEPRVLIEPPYSALGHPRLATEMLTLARDEELFRWALGGNSDPAHPSNRPLYHPATRVVIDLEPLARAPRAALRRLEAIARSNGYWPARSCFEAAERRASRPERAARIRLTLNAAGRVIGARAFDTTAEPNYRRCVLERFRALRYGVDLTRKLDVELRVKQWPGDAPVPPRAPDSEPALRLPEQARTALQSLTPALIECYRVALAEDPRLWGRLAFLLRLAGDVVSTADEVETRFPNEAVKECARRAIVGARIPTASVSGLTLAVRFGQPPAPPAPLPPALSPAAAPAEPDVPAAPAAPPAPAPPAPQ